MLSQNEEEAYEDLNSRLPAVGDFVTTSDKLKGEVTSVNVLRQRVKVTVTLDGDEKEIREYPVSELKFKLRRKMIKSRLMTRNSRNLKNWRERKVSLILQMNDVISENERIDDLQCKGYRLIQNTACFASAWTPCCYLHLPQRGKMPVCLICAVEMVLFRFSCTLRIRRQSM